MVQQGFERHRNQIIQEGIPSVIPTDMCYLGWQDSLNKLKRLVEPEIADAQIKLAIPPVHGVFTVLMFKLDYPSSAIYPTQALFSESLSQQTGESEKHQTVPWYLQAPSLQILRKWYLYWGHHNH